LGEGFAYVLEPFFELTLNPTSSPFTWIFTSVFPPSYGLHFSPASFSFKRSSLTPGLWLFFLSDVRLLSPSFFIVFSAFYLFSACCDFVFFGGAFGG